MANVSLSPWQVFSLLFLIFYLIIKYLSNSLATLMLSIVYGGVMEIISKVINRYFNEKDIDSGIFSIFTCGKTPTEL